MNHVRRLGPRERGHLLRAKRPVVNKLISGPLEPVDHIGAKLEFENIRNDLEIYLSKTSAEINSE